MKKKTTLSQSILANNIITILIPMILFLLFVTFIIIDRYEGATVEKNRMIAETISDQFEVILEEPVSLANYIERELLIRNQTIDKSFEDSLGSMVSEYDYVFQLEIVDEKGIVFSGSDKAQLDMNRSGETYYKTLQGSKDGNFWNTPYISTATRGLAYSFAHKSSEGFYVVVYVDISALSDTSTDFALQFGDQIEVAIVDEFGKYLSHSKKENVLYRQVDENIPVIKSIVKGETDYARVTHDGIEQLLTVADINLAEWYVLVYQPSDIVFNVLSQLVFLFAGVFIIALVISTVYAFAYTKRISAFINRMFEAIDGSRDSQYKIDLPDFHYKDLNGIGDRFTDLMNEVRNRDAMLYEMAYFDSLTGLGNRQWLIDRIDNRGQDSTGTSALAYVDIDNFKLVNDIYGHDVGDGLLSAVSELLNKTFKEEHVEICRLSSDVFGVLFCGNFLMPSFADRLNMLSEQLQQGTFVESNIVKVSISVGLAIADEDSNSHDKLIMNADFALYEAKRSDRTLLRIFDDRMHERLHKKINMSNFLKVALQKDLFELHFQPQIDIVTDRIYGFEALVRMRDLNGELVSPGEFIPVAEDSGMIIEIGEWVLREAVSFIWYLNQMNESEYKMSVNISTIQLNAPGFVDKAMEIIGIMGDRRDLIEFEVTESVFIQSEGEALEAVKALNKEGVKFSLDDFGTGYSSLSYLTRMPFDILKIDRSFIIDVDTNEAKKEMLESIIEMGHKLSYSIIAEGVETMEQLGVCKSYGCDIIQGYLYSRPLPRAEIEKYIMNYKKDN